MQRRERALSLLALKNSILFKHRSDGAQGQDDREWHGKKERSREVSSPSFFLPCCQYSYNHFSCQALTVHITALFSFCQRFYALWFGFPEGLPILTEPFSDSDLIKFVVCQLTQSHKVKLFG